MPFKGVPDFGDVVLVPFPFTNQSTTKQRPAVVVSTRAYAQARPDAVLRVGVIVRRYFKTTFGAQQL